MIDQSLIFFLAAVIFIGALLLATLFFVKKGTKHLDVEKFRAKILAIEHQLKRDEPSSFHLSVINADKLVDQALRERGTHGNTMAERMKNTAQSFSDRNGIWTAHKLRNQIVHEPDFVVTYDQARYALANFRKALKDLGAI